MDAPRAHARAHAARFVEELGELVRFPTVAAQAAHRGDMERCARWLAAHLAAIGLDHAQVVPTSGHPFVYADRLRGDDRPTLLVYGHYDVQPADERWRTPPFSPTVRGDFLYGRGASDDKGQFFVHVKAIESWLRSAGELPLDVKVVIEGEEEIGSEGLIAWLSREPEALQADAAVISDMPMRAPGQPALTYAMRGSLSLDLEVVRPGPEVHAGLFGGAVLNPIQVLCGISASLHEADGRVAVGGFYDKVRAVGDDERAYLRRVGPRDDELLKAAGLGQAWGEADFTVYERTTIRPALTFNGCRGGYEGEGGKAVIPTRASAKLNLRLVPDQDPAEIERLVRAHVAARRPEGVTVDVHKQFAARPVFVDPRHPAVHAAAAAYRDGFGRVPVLLRSGGTLPVASVFQHVLGVPVLMMGFALPDDRMHGPDERFSLTNFHRGIATSVSLLARLPAALRRTRMASVAGGNGHGPWPVAATP
jgi:acetylornithine deacetylase/succinyl-diaminopimelate desuccinylase-like protein